MSRPSIERELTGLSAESRSLREELAVVDEQLDHFADAADDARLRAMVSETPQAESEASQAARTVAAFQRDREAKLRRLAAIEARQDALLDQLTEVTR